MRTSHGVIAIAGVVAALAAVQPATAARVYAGQPKGGSGFQQVLSLSDNGKKVTGLTFHVDVSCPTDFRSVDFGTAQIVSSLPDRMLDGRHYLAAKISGTSLRGTLTGADRIDETTAEFMSASITGTVKDGIASGRIGVRFADVDVTTFQVLAQCDKTIAWKAQRNPGVIYGGTTSQGEPVVVELTPNRRKVEHAHLSWLAPCSAGGAWTDPHDEFDLRPFPLSGGGAFNRTYRFDMGQGLRILEHFAGKVTKTQAAGAFRGDVTLAGDAPDSCTTGAVSWRARTG